MTPQRKRFQTRLPHKCVVGLLLGGALLGCAPLVSPGSYTFRCGPDTYGVVPHNLGRVRVFLNRERVSKSPHPKIVAVNAPNLDKVPFSYDGPIRVDFVQSGIEMSLTSSSTLTLDPNRRASLKAHDDLGSTVECKFEVLVY